MEEPELFIEKITINEVRHLKDVEIPISTTERKHLILTGKNGSGKTSSLIELKKTLSATISSQGNYFKLIAEKENLQKTIFNTKNQLEKNPKNTILNNNLTSYQSRLKHKEKEIHNLSRINIDLIKSNYVLFQEAHREGKFVLVFFDAKRNSNLLTPQSIKKIKLKDSYNFDEKASSNFLQYIVNLKADRSFAKDDNELEVVREIDTWFNRFVDTLKFLFDEPSLKLVFDRKDYNFNIILKDEQKIPFNALSDGYSAILNIVMELMLRMEGKVKNVYDIQGIVLIDEIETHLHIDLQNKILPFLTSFFPKIQFIVSTHSPFVLNSISNAVIYDLEKNIRIEDMSDYPADGIVKGYFDSDEYSQAGIKKIREYEKLALNGQLNEQQQERFDELHMEFRDISGKLAPQLKSEFYRIELARKTRVHAKANG